jgi:hypothetical protein
VQLLDNEGSLKKVDTRGHTKLGAHILIYVKIRQKSRKQFPRNLSHIYWSEKTKHISYNTDKNLICANGPLARTLYNLMSHKFTPMFKERKAFDAMKACISDD